MKNEQSAGIVIFKEEGGKRQYLLLHYGKGSRARYPFWDFSKGHIEEGEDELQAAKREAREETGLTDINILEGFKEKIEYYFDVGKDRVSKTVVFFTGEIKKGEVTISFEHMGFKWLPFKEAIETLTFKNAKNILKKVEALLN